MRTSGGTQLGSIHRIATVVPAAPLSGKRETDLKRKTHPKRAR